MTGKQQLVAFEETDVLVAVHGSVLTNIIFMLPHSAPIELFPPKYSYTCFYRLSLNDKIDYTKIKGYVEQDPVCPPGTRCGLYGEGGGRDAGSEVCRQVRERTEVCVTF